MIQPSLHPYLKRSLLYGAILSVGLLSIGPRAAAYDEQSVPSLMPEMNPHYFYDEGYWSDIPIPEGTLFCTRVESADSTEQPYVRCMTIPKGSILLIPTPGDSL